MRLLILLYITILSLTVFNNQVCACSTFFLRNGDHMVCGRNFDYSLIDYLIFVNKRNVTKSALQYSDGNFNNPLIWTSKYGSITFNISGQEFATDGMNETGLVVTALVLQESAYKLSSGSPEIYVDQWVQYLLDNFSSVSEVINACSSINIRVNPYEFWKLHIFVTDRQGNNAVIEFLEGQLVVHTAETLEKNAITNTTYEESLAYYKSGILVGPVTSSINRYYRAVTMIDSYNNENIIDYSYAILDTIQQGHTNRKIVYDLSNMRIYLKSFRNDKLRFFDFSNFNFSCTTPVLIHKETLQDIGEINDKFVEYSQEVNKIAIETAWIFLHKPYDAEELENFSQFPGSYFCDATYSASISAEKDFVIKSYPNPVKDFINLDIDGMGYVDFRYKILNIYGQVLDSRSRNSGINNNQIKIDVSCLPKGEYILQLINDINIYSIRFTK